MTFTRHTEAQISDKNKHILIIPWGWGVKRKTKNGKGQAIQTTYHAL